MEDNYSIDLGFSEYIIAYYYVCVTMVSVGYGDISPQSQLELILCIFSMMFTCGMFAFTINKIGLVLSVLQQEANKKDFFMQSINKYMKKKRISNQLQYNIREYVHYYFLESIEEDVQTETKMFEILSDSLKSSLLQESNTIALKTSPIFKQNFSKSLIQKSISIVSEVKYVPEQYVYVKEDIGNDMYFVSQGQVEVIYGEIQDKKIKKPQTIKIFQEGDYFGEREFFTNEKRSYTVRSKEFSSLMKISRKNFLSLLREYPEDFEIFQFLKDKIMLNKDQSKIGTQCFSCQSKFHNNDKCSYVNYMPNRNKLIFEFNKSEFQQRFKLECQDISKQFNSQKLRPRDISLISQKQVSRQVNKRTTQFEEDLLLDVEKFFIDNIDFLESEIWYLDYCENQYILDEQDLNSENIILSSQQTSQSSSSYDCSDQNESEDVYSKKQFFQAKNNNNTTGTNTTNDYNYHDNFSEHQTINQECNKQEDSQITINSFQNRGYAINNEFIQKNNELSKVIEEHSSIMVSKSNQQTQSINPNLLAIQESIQDGKYQDNKQLQDYNLKQQKLQMMNIPEYQNENNSSQDQNSIQNSQQTKTNYLNNSQMVLSQETAHQIRQKPKKSTFSNIYKNQTPEIIISTHINNNTPTHVNQLPKKKQKKKIKSLSKIPKFISNKHIKLDVAKTMQVFDKTSPSPNKVSNFKKRQNFFGSSFNTLQSPGTGQSMQKKYRNSFVKKNTFTDATQSGNQLLQKNVQYNNNGSEYKKRNSIFQQNARRGSKLQNPFIQNHIQRLNSSNQQDNQHKLIRDEIKKLSTNQFLQINNNNNYNNMEQSSISNYNSNHNQNQILQILQQQIKQNLNQQKQFQQNNQDNQLQFNNNTNFEDIMEIKQLQKLQFESFKEYQHYFPKHNMSFVVFQNQRIRQKQCGILINNVNQFSNVYSATTKKIRSQSEVKKSKKMSVPSIPGLNN